MVERPMWGDPRRDSLSARNPTSEEVEDKSRDNNREYTTRRRTRSRAKPRSSQRLPGAACRIPPQRGSGLGGVDGELRKRLMPGGSASGLTVASKLRVE